MPNKPSDKFTVVENIISSIGSMLPANMSEEIKESYLRSLQLMLDRMDIVTRSELEVQEAVLQRTRQKVKELEARVAKLEEKHN